jgi:hypothetical protein
MCQTAFLNLKHFEFKNMMSQELVAIWDAEIRRITFQNQPGQTV